MLSFILFLLLLSPLRAYATTYYVSTGGSDSNSCSAAQSITAPKQSIANAQACMSGGDTLYFRAGTYTTPIILTDAPSGLSSSQPITFAAYPGDPVWSVILRPTGGDGAVITPGATTPRDYIVVEGFRIDGINSNGNSLTQFTDKSNSKLLNNLIENYFCHGTAVFGTTTNVLVRGNTYRNGPRDPSELCQGYYGWGSGHIIENNIFENGYALAIQVYCGTCGLNTNNTIVRNNSVNNYGHGATFQAIAASGGSNIKIYNNTISNSYIGVTIDSPSGVIYNNTFYNIANQAIEIRDNTSQQVVNNIMYLTNGIVDYSSTATKSNNPTSNPGFVNTSTRDFHLSSSGSSAVGACLNLGGTYGTDKDGVARPSVASWDCGAYQFAPGTPTVYHLEVTVQPSNGFINQVLPDWTVVVKDETNTLVTSYNGPISIALGTNPSGATLTGTTSGNFTSGVATWCCDLVLNQLGVGYTFIATATSLGVNVTTSSFTISNVTVPTGTPPLVMRFVPR